MTWQGTWNGDDLVRLKDRATEEAMGEVLDEAVRVARTSHSWEDRTGEASASIQREPTIRRVGERRAGSLFSSLARFIYLELGSRGRSGDNTLRRAGDVAFPKLGRRIKRRLAR